MPALAGFRRRLAASLRGRGGAMPRKGKAAGKEPSEPGAPAGPVVAAGDGGVRVSVRAKPGSRCSAVTDVTAEAVGVAIAAPPSEGEANAELCRYLSKVLEVKKSDVILEKLISSTGEFSLRVTNTPWEAVLKKDLKVHIYQKFAGGKSRDKVVKILVSLTPDEVLEKLKKEAST